MTSKNFSGNLDCRIKRPIPDPSPKRERFKEVYPEELEATQKALENKGCTILRVVRKRLLRRVYYLDSE